MVSRDGSDQHCILIYRFAAIQALLAQQIIED